MAKKPRNKKERQDEICRFVLALRQNFQDRTAYTRKRWELARQLLVGQQDWGAWREKNPWMSKVFLHEYGPMVRRVASGLVNTILQQPQFFNLTRRGEEDEWSKILEKVILYQLKQEKFERKLFEFFIEGGSTGIAIFKLTPSYRVTDHPEMVLREVEEQYRKDLSKLAKDVERPTPVVPNDPEDAEAALRASLAGIIDKSVGPLIPEIQAKKVFEVIPKLGLVSPFNMFWDPEAAHFNDSFCHIEQMFPLSHDVEAMFEAGTLDKDKRKEFFETPNYKKGEISSNWSGTHDGQAHIIRQEYQSKSDKYVNNHELIEYFGPWLDEEGRVVEENCHFIVGNGKVLLKDTKNTLLTGKSSYFATVFSPLPFKNDGAGVADPAQAHQILINEIASHFVDMVRLAVYSPKLVSSDKIADISEVEAGFAPMQTVEVYGDTKNAVDHIPNNLEITPFILQTIEMLRLSGERGSSMDLQSGNPASRARISATEVQSNLSRGDESRFTLAQIVDSECIEELLRRQMAIALQFSFEQEGLEALRLKGVLSESEYELISQMSLRERYEELTKHFQVEVRGFRSTLERNDQLARLNEFAVATAQNPAMSQIVNYRELGKQIALAAQLDADKLINQHTPQDKAREENVLLANNQMLMVGEQDDDVAELPVHYELLSQGPTQAAVQHAQQHLMRIIQAGEQPPLPDDPQIQELLGVGEQAALPQ